MSVQFVAAFCSNRLFSPTPRVVMDSPHKEGETETNIYAPSSSYTKTFVNKQDAWAALRYFIRRGLPDEACRMAIDLLASSKNEEQHLAGVLGEIVCEDIGYDDAPIVLGYLTRYRRRVLGQAFKSDAERQRFIISIVYCLADTLKKPTHYRSIAFDAARAIAIEPAPANPWQDDADDGISENFTREILRVAACGVDEDKYLKEDLRDALHLFVSSLCQTLSNPPSPEGERWLLYCAHRAMMLAMAHGGDHIGQYDRAERKKQAMSNRDAILKSDWAVPYFFTGFDDWHKSVSPGVRRLSGAILPGVRTLLFMAIRYCVLNIDSDRAEQLRTLESSYPWDELWLHGGSWLDDLADLNKAYANHGRCHLFTAILACTRKIPRERKQSDLKYLSNVDNVLQRDPDTRRWYIPLIGEQQAFTFDWKDKEALAAVRDSLPRLTDHMDMFTLETLWGKHGGNYDMEVNVRRYFVSNELSDHHIEDLSATHPAKNAPPGKEASTVKYWWDNRLPSKKPNTYHVEAEQAYVASGTSLDYLTRLVTELRDEVGIAEPEKKTKQNGKKRSATDDAELEKQSSKKKVKSKE